MSELYEKSLLKLELDQVLSLLAECAGSTEGKAACLRQSGAGIAGSFRWCFALRKMPKRIRGNSAAGEPHGAGGYAIYRVL